MDDFSLLKMRTEIYNEIIQKINKERSQSEHLLEKKKKQWEKLRNEFYELKEKYEKF